MQEGANFDQNNIEPCKEPAVEILSRRCTLMGTGGLGTLIEQCRAMVQLRVACNDFHLGKEGNGHATDQDLSTKASKPALGRNLSLHHALPPLPDGSR